MNYLKQDKGFTLIEVLAVIIIIAGLAAIAIPKLVSSTANAKQKADVATAHQVKAALDRYQVENGTYPKNLETKDGKVTAPGFIPNYISKLDVSTTQQVVVGKEGFGVSTLTVDESDSTLYHFPADHTPNRIIMIYLSADGLAAEVRAYDEKMKEAIWTSAD
ncbi:type II secretion system protein [Desulfosporosinus meridiei]|uniref:Prepilin-type N-terminal cleavage/methylation domain-containing protein n=1 Tax=Desulfosporosinus meridiei (strain ATCC BAA-275 / DSM 13257 / KCTC 12902 / NCIMB 13706 / S10) TaxID=768704 RepID=J7IWE3_DESMD|nr:prepilin-type N-terminal cleavage/methylation domain-containing protein [Desulfosporosinus meridiei]AFQ43026.1 prepilin-type N-terminal cleavage/methylation domain-containing protein [Desulfosporosinus meridiei DSM 13257]